MDEAFELWRDGEYDALCELLDEIANKKLKSGYFKGNPVRFWKAVLSYAKFRLRVLNKQQ